MSDLRLIPDDALVDLQAEVTRLRARIAELEAGQPVDRMGAWDDRYSGSAKEIEAHTIERCAQVADEKLKEHDGPYGCGPYTRAAIKSIAAAIRALKDKP